MHATYHSYFQRFWEHERFFPYSFRYFYRLLSGPDPLTTFEKDRAWHVTEEIDIPSMQVDPFLSEDPLF